MANNPVFEVLDTMPFVSRRTVGFTYYPGFSVSQRQRSAQSLHNSWQKQTEGKILEISGASDRPLGRALSAFSLMLSLEDGRQVSVECVFQGSKCFEWGGPYTDLYFRSSREAKTDPRLKESGRLIRFSANGNSFPLNPPTFFYDWLYVNALIQNPQYHRELLTYDAFTDIYFNPEKQINCQAEAAAIFVGLSRSGNLDEALRDRETFRRIVFG